jgi:hypothetical protein
MISVKMIFTNKLLIFKNNMVNKLLLFVCGLFLSITNNAQELSEKNITTQVSEVTVFINDAQITRKKSVELKKGITILKFVDLSPFIDAKSIQVKVDGNVTVLSVNHQQNYIDKLEKKPELVDLEAKLKAEEDKINLQRTYLDILKEELAFIRENRNIGGKNEELNVNNLREASNFYSSKLTALKLKEIEINKELEVLNKSKLDLENQIKTITSSREFPNGEILVKVDTKNYTTANVELSYIVGNAGWFPSYDIRAKNVNEPIDIVYKANVKQDTKVDWKNVKLNLSSANPNISGVVPELQPYFLNYNTLPPRYDLSSNEITGRVFDEDQLPLPGANILVKGTTIGASTDFDGNFSITIPDSSSELVFSYIGYETQVVPVRSSNVNVYLKENNQVLEEVVVVGYGTKRNKKISNSMDDKAETAAIRGAGSLQIPLGQVAKQTTIEFEIDIPYSITSDNKNYTVDMASYELPANYKYFCVPKVNNDAFLMANISDWEKYNLLEGEANIFFENTYVGKTLLDVRYASDTLQISLGRDKNVSVKREKIKDYSTKQFIGSRKEESRAYSIVVKNNKTQKIDMLIFDQVPVSTLEEIKVEVSEISGAKQNMETGEIKWEFSIDPNQTKIFELKYAVKYPKNRTLIIE